ncbi:MAG: hypothetical protein ACE14V_15660 [bacterium]
MNLAKREYVEKSYMKKETSIILELQSLAIEKEHDITDLLRKALLVATKLNLNDFREWVLQELQGYKKGVPDYRKCRAEIFVKNPYRGLIPFFFPDREIADIFCNVELREPIGNIIALLEKFQSDSKITISLDPELIQLLLETQDPAIQMLPVRIVSHNQIEAIIDAVRNTILKWALKLEQEGILGENLTFSEDEKRKAAASTEIRIDNFQGILGNVENSSVSQDLQMTIKKEDIASLRAYLISLGIIKEDIDELEQIIAIEGRPTKVSKFGEKVSGWIGKMISKAASGTWDIAVGSAGSLLAQAIAKYYGL